MLVQSAARRRLPKRAAATPGGRAPTTAATAAGPASTSGPPGSVQCQPLSRRLGLAVQQLLGYSAVQGGRSGQEFGEPRRSSAYDGSRNVDVGLAVWQENHLLQVGLGQQTVAFEGFPNQRMDMTSNRNTQDQPALRRQFRVGRPGGAPLRPGHPARDGHGARPLHLRHQHAHGHRGNDPGAVVVANCAVRHRPGAAGRGSRTTSFTTGGHQWGHDGTEHVLEHRPRPARAVGAFAELGPVGRPMGRPDRCSRQHRHDKRGAGAGYDNGLPALWGNDAAAFNAQNRRRTDHTGTSPRWRYAPAPTMSVEGRLCSASRSPNLYQRYAAGRRSRWRR